MRPDRHLHPRQELRAVLVHDLPRLAYLGVGERVGVGKNPLRDALFSEKRLERREERAGTEGLGRRVDQRPYSNLFFVFLCVLVAPPPVRPSVRQIVRARS